MTNIYILGPLALWLVAQLLKFFIHLVRGQADIRYLIAAGGLPSAHAAVVCSLAVITLIEQGLSSPLFGVTVILAAIVMYDSFGVRRSSGEQAHILNRLTWDLQSSGVLKNPAEYRTLREILGHKPYEVVSGAALGVAGAVLLDWPKASGHLSWLTASLTTMQLRLYSYVILLVLIGSIAVWWWTKAKLNHAKGVRRPVNRLLVYGLIGTTVLILEAISAAQGIAWLRTRAVALGVMIAVLTSLSILYNTQVKRLLTAHQRTPELERKQRWLKKAKRR